MRYLGLGRPLSEFSRIIERLGEGEWHCFGECSASERSKIVQTLNGSGYIRRHYPDRKFVSRTVDGKVYVVRLKAEDIK